MEVVFINRIGIYLLCALADPFAVPVICLEPRTLFGDEGGSASAAEFDVVTAHLGDALALLVVGFDPRAFERDEKVCSGAEKLDVVTRHLGDAFAVLVIDFDP